MKNVAIICLKENLVFRDLAVALFESFLELGRSVINIETIEEIQACANNISLAVVLAPFDYPNIRYLLPNSQIALWQLEILPWVRNYNDPVRRSQFRKWPHLRWLIRDNYDIVLDYDKLNIDNNLMNLFSTKKIGYLPVGYSPIFEGQIEEIQQDQVALFVGNISKRRSKILGHLWSKKRPIRSVRGIYGAGMIQLMKGAAINLNIHNSDVPVFETPRVVQHCFTNKCFVMSEPCVCASEFVDGIHWASAPYNFFPDMINYYLDRPEKRREIIENAYSYIRQSYTMTQHLDRILRLLEM
jgi:hypothetical protein